MSRSALARAQREHRLGAASSTPTQPGPLSTHWASTMSARSMPSTDTIRRRVSSSTGPERSSGGAANASAPSIRRSPIRPASHSWITRPRAVDPAARQPGVAGAERRVAGERKLPAGREDPHPVVGPSGFGRQDERRLRQVRPAGEALHLLCVRPVASSTTATGLPRYSSSAKTSTWQNGRSMGPSVPRARLRAADGFLPRYAEFLPSRRGAGFSCRAPTWEDGPRGAG